MERSARPSSVVAVAAVAVAAAVVAPTPCQGPRAKGCGRPCPGSAPAPAQNVLCQLGEAGKAHVYASVGRLSNCLSVCAVLHTRTLGRHPRLPAGPTFCASPPAGCGCVAVPACLPAGRPVPRHATPRRRSREPTACQASRARQRAGRGRRAASGDDAQLALPPDRRRHENSSTYGGDASAGAGVLVWSFSFWARASCACLCLPAHSLPCLQREWQTASSISRKVRARCRRSVVEEKHAGECGE